MQEELRETVKSTQRTKTRSQYSAAQTHFQIYWFVLDALCFRAHDKHFISIQLQQKQVYKTDYFYFIFTLHWQASGFWIANRMKLLLKNKSLISANFTESLWTPENSIVLVTPTKSLQTPLKSCKILGNYRTPANPNGAQFWDNIVPNIWFSFPLCEFEKSVSITSSNLSYP